MAGFPVLRGNHVVVGRHVNVVDYIEEDTRHQTFLQLVAVVVVPIAAETQDVDERADEIVDDLLVVRYQRFLVESIEHNPCISVARQQTAYCRERIAYHRDEAPLALADAVNDDIGRNKQQGRCYCIIRVGENRIAVFFCKVLQLITC